MGVDKTQDNFKDSKTLLEEMRARGQLGRREMPLPEATNKGMRARRTPRNNSQRVCEYYNIKGCTASQEAVELGLSGKVFLCQGLIPPDCAVRRALASGKTVSDLFKKA